MATPSLQWVSGPTPYLKVTTPSGGVLSVGFTDSSSDSSIELPGGYLDNPMTALGDIIYGGPDGTPYRLGIGSTGQFISIYAGIPYWKTPVIADISNTTTIGRNFATLANPGAIVFFRGNVDSTVSSLSASDFRTAIDASVSSHDHTAITGSANSLKSNTTTGLMQIVGPTAGTTRVKTVRDADDTVLELGGSYSPSGDWTYTKTVAIGLTTASACGVELGNNAGTATTPFLDFHCSGNAIDYDVRLIASGGDGTSGNGKITIASQFVETTATGSFTFAGNATAAHILGPKTTGTSLIVRTPSLNSSFDSGLAVDGVYSTGSKTSTVNIRAFGVCSGGGYNSELVFHTSLGGGLNQVLKLDSAKQATFAGKIAVDDTTDATSTTAAGLQTDSGLGVVKKTWLGDALILEGNVVKKVIKKTSIDDNAATNLFTVTTTNETGDHDAGGYAIKIKATIIHGGTTVGDSAAVAVVHGEYAFSRAMSATGTGVNGTVETVKQLASVATNAATSDIGTITWTVTETSEYVQTVAITVDLTGTTIGKAYVTAEVELSWVGFTTRPTIAQA